MTASELPSGTVTLLFTDIESSTTLLSRLGDERYAEQLEVHRGLLRRAFGEHRGIEVNTEGDSFFVCFTSAADALHSAVAGQRALAGLPARVRMGVHSGEALLHQGDYTGLAVHRARRICDAAHGGQILVSHTTADLVAPALSEGTALQDLGPHRLRDLGQAERLFQVVADGIARSFPPPRSMDAYLHTLPVQRTTFVGHERSLEQLALLLDRHRIVTVTGVGGCGKTRLAVQVAADHLDAYPDGVFFADLAPVADPNLVTATVATAVELKVTSGTAPLAQDLTSFLSRKKALLLLDNCEHLLDSCAELTDHLLANSRDLTVLATSREALEVDGEQTWRVPSLALPAPGEPVRDAAAVRLFCDRAAAVQPGFALTDDNVEIVADICRRLDGIPLAIELAASRVSHLSLRQIDERLDDRFRLLAGGRRRVQRQQTLQAAMDWSYELLDPAERALLRRLSVLAAGFTLEAAEGICGDEEGPAFIDLLASLVSKSLVDVLPGKGVHRYRLLETVRIYAAHRLMEAGETEECRDRHREWYARWVETSFPIDRNFQSDVAADAFSDEHDNLRAALSWSRDRGRLDLVGRLASHLMPLWSSRHYEEGESWLRLALDSGDELSPDDRVGCLVAAAWCTTLRGDGPAAEDLVRLATALPGARPSVVLAFAFSLRGFFRGIASAISGDPAPLEEAREMFARGSDIARTTANPLAEAAVRVNEGYVRLMVGDYAGAVSCLSSPARRLDPVSQGGTERMMRAHAGIAHHLLGDDGAAMAALGEVPPAQTERPIGVSEIRNAAAVTLASVGRGAEARTLVADTIAALRDCGIPVAANDCLIVFGAVASIEGDHERASRLFAAATNLRAGWLTFRSPITIALFRHYVPIVRDGLGSERARETRAEGQAMSFEEAVEYALSAGEAATP